MPQEPNVADLKLTSPAFHHHERIPDVHSGDGEDVSPELTWSGAPEGTRSFAVVVHDPDAPLIDGVTHWVVYNIPGNTNHLPEGGGDAITHGTNSMGNAGYDGPAPPAGHGTHHYYFWVYALDEDLDLPPGLDRRALTERIADHVIEQARLVGTFSR